MPAAELYTKARTFFQFRLSTSQQPDAQGRVDIPVSNTNADLIRIRPTLVGTNEQNLLFFQIAEASYVRGTQPISATQTVTATQNIMRNVAKPGRYGQGEILESGGSNYTVYSAKDGLMSGSARPVIGTYHLDPETVKAQMNALFKAGQKKITFFLWHAPFLQPQSGDCKDSIRDIFCYIVNSKGGNLPIQAQANLRDLLRLAKHIGFEHITLRFGQQGGASPNSYNSPWNQNVTDAMSSDPSKNGWSEEGFQENLKFIINTRNIMEDELSGSSIKRLYDLGVELGGIAELWRQDPTTHKTIYPPSFLPSMYRRRLWAEYVRRYGSHDSYGFSVANNPNRFWRLINDFDQSGAGRPDLYAVDVYKNVYRALDWSYNELKRAGEQHKPLIIQETLTNSETVAQEIISFLKDHTLKIKFIHQWPGYESPSSPTAEYGYYGGSWEPSGAISASSCTMGAAKNESSCSFRVSWLSANATQVKLLVNGDLLAEGASGTITVPWVSSSPAVFKLMSEQGELSEFTGAAP